ncbi:prepilin peptidase [Granulicoccus sp. GXG6511]|uniref:prepilin peptidase n=1 Tax=Granulicoccus sp. GXG6511 TaxID=3381351 RepID=UPI003D7CB8DC
MWTMALVAALGVLTGLATAPVLRALPEPVSDDARDKPLYRTLATSRFAIATAACAMAAGAVLALRLPPAAWVTWLPLSTVGMLLVAIDARTTWMPLPLSRALWLSTLVAGAAHVALAPPADRGPVAVRMALGAAAVGLFFWVFWRMSGSLGFGDVRLAPVLGAVTASMSWSALIAGLLLGTIAGALHGVVRHARGRHGPFPYGPALTLGAFLGVLVAR